MKLDRMIGILSILLQQDKVTAPYLAEKFEVSRRTISRDIEALCMAGIPLVTEQGKNGGISIMEGYKIDHTLLSTSDMQAILAGLRSLDSVSGTNRYAQLMEKLSVGASNLLAGDTHILIDLSSWYKASLSPKIELLHDAILSQHKVSFTYFSPAGESQRILEYGLYCNGKIFAVICEDQLFIKITESGRNLCPELSEAPPYQGAKNYFLVEDVENQQLLTELVTATCEELPEPKPKKKKKE